MRTGNITPESDAYLATKLVRKINVKPIKKFIFYSFMKFVTNEDSVEGFSWGKLGGCSEER